MTRTIALLTLAGLASPLCAQSGDPLTDRQLIPTRTAGALYVNMATGERTLTRYARPNEALPEIDIYHSPSGVSGGGSGGALFDYWRSVDVNPCWDDARADGFGYSADAPTDPADGITRPVAGFDFGDMPFDSKITGITLSTVTLATEDTDSNADGVLDTGIDSVAVYYDALSEGNRTSIAAPTAAVRVDSIPGQRDDPDGYFESYQLVVDFGPGNHFELGDSDGQNRGSMWLPGAAQGLDYSAITTTESGATAPNPTADGLADFQQLQYYAKHGSNDKVTADSTFISLAAVDGVIVFTTHTETTWTTCPTFPSGTITCYTTITSTYLIPDQLPAGQSALESVGIGQLGPGGDPSSIDWSIAGCCFWFGGLDCAGFLDQLEVDPPYNGSWYGFNPFAQNAMGFFSDAPHQSSCTALDFLPDAVLDSGDINAFIQLFVAQDPLADLNNDAITDNGDIAAFINLYLACVN